MQQRAVDATTSVIVCASLLLISIFRLSIDGLSGHMDEYDYLFVGKTLLSGGSWPTHTYIFGWDFNWLLLAWGDTHIGGLAGARFISVLLGFISIAGMYVFVLMLWNNKTTALLAALLLSLDAAHLHISKLATYDIISFTFLVWSLPALILACRTSRQCGFWAVVASVLLAAAVLSKYTALLYLPVIALLVLLHAPKQALVGIVLIGGALAAYAFVHFDQLLVLYEIQINGAHDKNATYKDIVNRIGRQQLIFLLAASLSVIYAVTFQRSTVRPMLGLILMASPLLVYHFLSQNVISLQKHVVFSSLFIIPIIAWGLTQAIAHTPRLALKNAFLASALTVFGMYNFQQLGTINNSFVSVEPVVPYAKDIMASESVLSEDPYLFRYLMFNRVDQSNISETTWLDHNGDGQHQFADVELAISAGRFHYVFLNDQQHTNGNKNLRYLLSQNGYTTLMYEPYELATMSGEKRNGIMTLHARADSNVSLLENE